MGTGIIYEATCKTTGLCYIGQTVDLHKRMKSHKTKSKTIECKFYDAIRQYGWEDFVWETLEECDEHLLNEREIYWISYCNSYQQGYNEDKGGGYGYKSRHPSGAARQLMSNANKGRKKSDEVKNAISQTLTGYIHSAEARKNMSKAGKGRILSSEHCMKIGEANRKRKGRCWITNGNVNKIVDKNTVEKYISNGWRKGRTKKVVN